MLSTCISFEKKKCFEWKSFINGFKDKYFFLHIHVCAQSAFLIYPKIENAISKFFKQPACTHIGLHSALQVIL